MKRLWGAGENEVSLASSGTAIRSIGSAMASAWNGVGEELDRKGNERTMLERSQGLEGPREARSGPPWQGCWYYQHTPCASHNCQPPALYYPIYSQIPPHSLN